MAATGTGSTLLARHLRAGEHQQVGAVAAHPGGQVIEPEQAVQPLGILLVALQPVDQRELLVDQRTAAPRHRLEHVVDLQPQSASFTGQEQRLFVQFVHRVRDLTDFLGGVHRHRVDGSGLVAGPHPVDFALQVVVRDLAGRRRAACAAAESATAPPAARCSSASSDRCRTTIAESRMASVRRSWPGPRRPGHRGRRGVDDLGRRSRRWSASTAVSIRVVDQRHGRVGHQRRPA